MAARSVWWRGRADRLPDVNSPKRSSSRLADLLHAHHLDARGGQLDRKRDAAQPPADLYDGFCILIVQTEPGLDHLLPAPETVVRYQTGRGPAGRHAYRAVTGRARAGSPRQGYPNASWLVIRIFKFIQLLSSRSTSWVQAAIRCSQLSRTSKIFFERSWLTRRSAHRLAHILRNVHYPGCLPRHQQAIL